MVFRAAVGFLILTATQRLVAAQENFVPGTERVRSQSTRDSLFRRLNNDDRSIRDSARTTLHALGFSQQEIDRTRTWLGSDPQKRNASANASDPARLLMLSRDVDHRVRSAALDALRHSRPRPQFVSRVREMATSDGDPTVRGFARLLAAEWAAEAAVPKITESAGTARLTPQREPDFDSVSPPPPGFDAVVPFWIKASSQADAATDVGFMMPVTRDRSATITLSDRHRNAATTFVWNPFETGDGRWGDARDGSPETQHVFVPDAFHVPPDTDVSDAVPSFADENGSYLETQQYATGIVVND